VLGTDHDFFQNFQSELIREILSAKKINSRLSSKSKGWIFVSLIVYKVDTPITSNLEQGGIMTNEKVVQLTPKYIETYLESLEKAPEVLAKLPKHEVEFIVKYLTDQFIEEIKQGLEGEIEYKDAPFFEVVDRLYEDVEVKGCYFCDRSIDGNAEPFDYPNNTRLCLTCMEKAANLLVAFGIDHGSLFPGMGDRKIQKVIYNELPEVKRAKGEVIH